MRLPLIYHDASGVLDGTLETDGRSLVAVIAGCGFAGDLDGLEPREPDALPSRFALATGALCACRLAFTLPIAVIVEGREHAAELGVELELGVARPGGGLEREVVTLELRIGPRRLRSSGTSGWFEDEILELQRAAPDVAWKTCFGCALSDYSPYGHGLFGNLLCFRDNRAAYRAVTTKVALFEILETCTEQVQETHVCPTFERRAPSTGYRG